jgi:CheY-like chemotaxis protein
MRKLLVVDDEAAMRRLIRLNLGNTYEIVETGVPEEALAIALEQKPDTILLDLRMPKYSGYELCRTFTSFGATQLIPVVVISGEAGSKTRDFCRDLGVAAYFEKPVDFSALGQRLEELLRIGKKERRREVRVPLSVPLKLRGVGPDGKTFELSACSENVSVNGFLFTCDLSLETHSFIDVYLVGSGGPVGSAQIMRCEGAGTKNFRYGCRFIEKTGNWVLQ